ncbi:hypothetical protein RD1_3586 [Roseobacter denitrificans OCh 114]|uniref:Uncharacterized protein n=1 Tax=Roseobacter denitrificans (strain ATCC 33942 / OCh 114) TaxID=375451 RepID=Q162M8_ROSDO|nr:hypothetical protein RD1_3586 [Roseobacter denitrificans OCh 114]
MTTILSFVVGASPMLRRADATTWLAASLNGQPQADL